MLAVLLTSVKKLTVSTGLSILLRYEFLHAA